MRPPTENSQLVIAAPLRIEKLTILAGAPRLRVQRVGMGPARARTAAQLLKDDPARALIVLGVCGGLISGDRPGEVIIAERLSTVDERGELENPTDCHAPRQLAEALERQGLSVRNGTVASAARIVHGQARTRLKNSGADAVDMESAWLQAGARGRPFVVIRVVADTPDHDINSPIRAVASWVSALRALRYTARALGTLQTRRELQGLLQ